MNIDLIVKTMALIVMIVALAVMIYSAYNLRRHNRKVNNIWKADAEFYRKQHWYAIEQNNSMERRLQLEHERAEFYKEQLEVLNRILHPTDNVATGNTKAKE